MEWLGNPLLYVFVSFFGPVRVQRSVIVFLSFWTYWPIEKLYEFIHSQFLNKKQRIVHCQGASNINYSTVVFNLDVLRLSWPVSSTNYGWIYLVAFTAAEKIFLIPVRSRLRTIHWRRTNVFVAKRGVIFCLDYSVPWVPLYLNCLFGLKLRTILAGITL